VGPRQTPRSRHQIIHLEPGPEVGHLPPVVAWLYMAITGSEGSERLLLRKDVMGRKPLVFLILNMQCIEGNERLINIPTQGAKQ
jgi:hypothetical protein